MARDRAYVPGTDPRTLGILRADAETDYDMSRYLREGGQRPEDPSGHYPDTYKKPTHPTFSEESIYHGPEAQGGRWQQMPDGSYTFVPGPMNYQGRSIREMQDYFRRVEPGNRLKLQQE